MATEESKKKFCWGEIMQEEKVCAGDLCLPCRRPSHAGDKAITWETPVQRPKGGGLTGMMKLYFF